MLGWTHKVNWSHWLRLKVLAFGIVAAAVFAGAASARPDEGASRLTKASEIPYLSHGVGIVEQGAGGVTPTDLARVVQREPLGGVTPTNLARTYVPRTVDQPALIRDVPDGVQADVRQTSPTTSFVSDNGGSLDESALALGFGLGLALSGIAAIVLMLSRGRMRIAHS
jgi:hypothetical protein